jgi:hypothetical protein
MLALASAGQADVTAVFPALAPGVTLSGRFVQERHLQGLATPLKTEGDFVVAPNLGIIWRSEEPVRSVTVITSQGIRRFVNGSEVQRFASAKVPAFAHFYDALDDATIGDWSALENDFTIACTGDRRAWRIVLTPKRSEGPAATRLVWIVLTGGSRIDTVDLMRASGDSDHVVFLDQVVTGAPPSGPDAGLLRGKWE